ncbi:MAG: hypothetical protein JWM96_237 [Alphaproteobacteria bacterium]|nr:hypothetical protein [Alphaproteobacteria bacterium]
MRFPIILFFLAALCLNSQAHAFGASSWQTQLQNEIKKIEAQSPDIKAQGEVTTEESGGVIRAILPTLIVTSPDKSQWTIPSITLQTNNADALTGPVTITLPAQITRQNAGKRDIAAMGIGQQNLSGTWNFASNSFQSLNGNLKALSFNDSVIQSNSTVSDVTIAATRPDSIDLSAINIATAGEKSRSSIGKLTLKYKLPGNNGLSLLRIVGLLNPALLVAENKRLALDATAEQISLTDSDNQTTTMEKLVSAIQVEETGKKVTGHNQLQAFIVHQSPESAYGFLLPRQLTMNSDIDDLPGELISFAPGMSLAMAKESMARAGTRITIRELNSQGFGPTVITGHGNLKANGTVPAGFTGRITLNIQGLNDAVASMQSQLLNQGGNKSLATQSMLVTMMLQGMARQNGNRSEFIIDLTPEGQILVNGQDLSGVLPANKVRLPTELPGGGAAINPPTQLPSRSVPVVPVTETKI